MQSDYKITKFLFLIFLESNNGLKGKLKTLKCVDIFGPFLSKSAVISLKYVNNALPILGSAKISEKKSL
jgi:hypothetical protein